MDKMSLFSILTVAVPEAVLNIYVAFVLTGHRSKLYLDDKLNIVRLIIAVSLMVFAAFLTRSVFTNLATILLANIALYIVILKFTYRLKWVDSILAVFIFVGILITIELTYVFQFLIVLKQSLSQYYSNDILRLISSLPERVLQLIIVLSFWRWDLVYLNIRNNKKLLFSFLLLAVALLSSEFIFAYTSIYIWDKLPLVLIILCSIGNFLFALVNFLICKIVIELTKKSNGSGQ